MMTETRGRALILSNDSNGTRAGSEHDHSNMERMLQKFGFVTAGGHRNYTAEVSHCGCNHGRGETSV